MPLTWCNFSTDTRWAGKQTRGDIAIQFWQRWYHIFGGRLYIRFEPNAFLAAEKRIANLIDNGKLVEAKNEILSLPCEWQNDREFIRLYSMCEFLNEEDRAEE